MSIDRIVLCYPEKTCVPVEDLFADCVLPQLRQVCEDDEWGLRSELAFVGLLSHFEAFCKALFAAVLNYESSLYTRLVAAASDKGTPWVKHQFVCKGKAEISAEKFQQAKSSDPNRVGSYVSEDYDFHTPQQVNDWFQAVLGVTPIGDDDVEKLRQLTLQRNLLVHNGGTFTRYFLSKIPRETLHELHFAHQAEAFSKAVS